MWRRSILQRYIDNPKCLPELHIAHSDRFVLIQDKYPKAKVHYLVLLRIEPIPATIHAVQPDHVPMLQEMHRFAMTELTRKGVHSEGLMFGFHVKPSLEPLHMHIISPDLSFVKRKEHWWSFTDGFISLHAVIDTLEAGSALQQSFITENILSCDGCSEKFRNLRELKSHRAGHL